MTPEARSVPQLLQQAIGTSFGSTLGRAELQQVGRASPCGGDVTRGAGSFSRNHWHRRSHAFPFWPESVGSVEISWSSVAMWEGVLNRASVPATHPTATPGGVGLGPVV